MTFSCLFGQKTVFLIKLTTRHHLCGRQSCGAPSTSPKPPGTTRQSPGKQSNTSAVASAPPGSHPAAPGSRQAAAGEKPLKEP